MLLFPHTQEELSLEYERITNKKQVVLENLLAQNILQVQQFFSNNFIGYYVSLSLERDNRNNRYCDIFVAQEEDGELENAEPPVEFNQEVLDMHCFGLKDVYFLNNGKNHQEIEKFFTGQINTLTPEQKEQSHEQAQKQYDELNQEILENAVVELHQSLLNLPNTEFEKLHLSFEFDVNTENFTTLLVTKYCDDTGFNEYIELENMPYLSASSLTLIQANSHSVELSLESKEEISKIYEWFLGAKGYAFEQSVRALSMHHHLHEKLEEKTEYKVKRKI